MRIRSYYNYVPRAISRPNVVLSAIHRESLARFAMLMTAGWHLAGIWKYAKACVQPIDVHRPRIPARYSIPLRR